MPAQSPVPLIRFDHYNNIASKLMPAKLMPAFNACLPEGSGQDTIASGYMDTFPWNAATLRRSATYLLVLICIALLVHEVFGPHGFLALRQERKEIERLREQIQQLRDENEQLDKRIKALQSNPKAIERLAREQMRLARPGELIYTLPENDSKKDQALPGAPAATAR